MKENPDVEIERLKEEIDKLSKLKELEDLKNKRDQLKNKTTNKNIFIRKFSVLQSVLLIFFLLIACFYIFSLVFSPNSTYTPTYDVQTTPNPQYLIDICNNDAFDDYHNKWISYCRVNNITIETKDGVETCSIPSNQGDEFDRQLQTAKEQCILRYK